MRTRSAGTPGSTGRWPVVFGGPPKTPVRRDEDEQHPNDHSASRRLGQASGLCSPEFLRRAVRGLLALILVGSLLYLLLPKPPLLDGVYFSREVFDRHGNRLAVTLSADEKYRIFTPLREISPELIAATLDHEDRWFERHPGFNPISLLRATGRFAVSGQRRVGASTITMQLARLRFGLHTRTVPGKLRQILYALEIERHYSKDEILEAYLNLAPYGGNFEGAGAASLAIFRKPAAKLSKYEALALSVIPQSPARRAPLRDRQNPALQAAMARRGGSEAENFQVFLRGIPQPEAPHFVRQSLRENDARQVRTTLDRDLQRLVGERLSIWLKNRRSLDLRNAAALLIDWRSMDVLAHLGSADFNNAAIHGQVDGTRARRSPGSTLKPFVYALAMEQGIIHPDSILLDAPRSFAGYNPENSDREFAGPIRASDALSRSRNIPAVELTRQLHSPGFYDFLKTAGVAFPKPASWYGLSLPLGGAEVRMTDLTRLYAMLANGGVVAGHAEAGNGNTKSASTWPATTRLLSPEAAFLTMEMLGRVPPPEGHSVHQPVYWKTGTSHGYHDAWSVGICGPYVLAVWLGNFDGRANPALLGRTAAAPLFFQILESLENHGRLPRVSHLPPPGANLRQVGLCAESGQLPGPHCPHHRPGWFIPGVSSISTCALHQEVIIDQESGLRLLGDDGTRAIRREVFEFWPADIQKLFGQAGLPRRQPPPFAPGQLAGFPGRGGLKILSPRPGAIYTRRADDADQREVALRINADANTRRVFWFSGSQFLGSCPPDQTLRWLPPAGTHQITVIDQDGRQAVAQIQVEVLGKG